MALKDDKIKDLFSSKLKNFEADVPTSVWEGINQQLSANAPTVSLAPKAKGRKIALVSTLVAVAAVLALVFVVIPTDNVKQDVNMVAIGNQTMVEPIINTDNQLIVNASTLDSNKKEETVSSASVAPLASRALFAKSDDKAGVTDINKQTEITAQVHALFGSDDNPTSGQGTSAEKSKEEKLTPSKKNKIEDLPEFLPYVILEEDQKYMASNDQSKSSGFGLNVAGNVGLLASNMSGNGNSNMLMSYDVRSSTFMELMESETNEVKLRHSQPISVGLLFSKRLTSRLSIESGIVYTHLSSKASTSEFISLRESQKFDYLGIPVNLNYTFYTWGKLNMYGTAGAMVQKDIQGSMKSQIVMDRFDNGTSSGSDILGFGMIDNSFEEPKLLKKNIHQRNLQVSLHTTVGVSYPIYKKLYLYGTFGGAYYIDADDKYETIYSDKRMQMDVNFGLKFNF